jgi:hypothetical protein
MQLRGSWTWPQVSDLSIAVDHAVEGILMSAVVESQPANRTSTPVSPHSAA